MEREGMCHLQQSKYFKDLWQGATDVLVTVDSTSVFWKMLFTAISRICHLSFRHSRIWIVYFLATFSASQSLPYPRHVCHPGTYLVTARNDLDFCLPCTDGVNFMPDSWHTHRNCYNCTQIRDQDLEILVTECTRTHDAEILCTPGYYRWRARGTREQDRCEKCFECEHPIRACQGFHDTVCCGAPNYDAVKNKDGVYVCQERPVLCGPGYFLNLNTRECSQCPPGTFMTEDKHDNPACRPCLEDSDLRPDQVVVEICNVTHQTVVGCRQEYFIDSSVEFSVGRVKCFPCQKCKQQIRGCDMYHNTVCCDDPDKKTVIVGSVTECRPRDHNQNNSNTLADINLVSLEKRFCGEDQYLYTNQSNNLTMCLPCEKGTYMKERNHTMTFCKDCSDVQGVLVPESCYNVTESTYRDERHRQIGLFLGIIIPSLALVSLIFVVVRRYQTIHQHRKPTQRTKIKKLERSRQRLQEVVTSWKCHTKPQNYLAKLRTHLLLHEKSSDENNEPCNTETVHMVRQPTLGVNDVQPESEDNQENSLMIDQGTSADNDLKSESEDNQETSLTIDQDTSADNDLKSESEDNQETSLMIDQGTSADNDLMSESEDNKETSLMIDQDTSGDIDLKSESEDNQDTSLMIDQGTSADNDLKSESEDNQETSLMIDQDTSGDIDLKSESEDNQETSLMIG